MTANVCLVMYNSRVINKNDISLNFDLNFIQKIMQNHIVQVKIFDF